MKEIATKIEAACTELMDKHGTMGGTVLSYDFRTSKDYMVELHKAAKRHGIKVKAIKRVLEA